MRESLKYKNDIFACKTLGKLGYSLPATYQTPKRNVYRWYYIIIFVTVIYSLLSILDVFGNISITFLSCILRFLSALNIAATLKYNMYALQAEINRTKNRQKIKGKQFKKIGTLNKKLFDIPFYIVLVLILITTSIGIVLFFKKWTVLLVIYKIAICTYSAINCMISCINNSAKFYRAEAISYV